MGGGKSKNKTSSKSSSYSTGRSSSSTGVWGEQSGALERLYAGAEGNLNSPYGYGQDRYAGMSGQTRAAIGGAFNAYGRGEANTDAASRQFQGTMRGDYLNPESNPHLQAQFDVGARGIKREYFDAVQGLGSRMEGSGRSGGGAEQFRGQRLQENLATGLGDFGAKLYGENYGRERQIQAGMAGQGGQITGAGWSNLQGLSGLGDREQMDRQGALSDQVKRFEFDRDARSAKLGEFRDLIGGPVMTSDARSYESTRSTSRSKTKGKSSKGGLV